MRIRRRSGRWSGRTARTTATSPRSATAGTAAGSRCGASSGASAPTWRPRRFSPAFKVSPKGYVFVRLDKLTNVYGYPDIEEIENFNRLYKQKLDEIIERGEISLDLALEVSSPGAERLLKVPEDLDRFKDMAMRVQYLAESDNDLVLKQNQLKDGIFLLESVDTHSEHCVWKLANVKENRAEAGKGRPLSRKQKDWRLQTSFTAVKKVTLYLDSN